MKTIVTVTFDEANGNIPVKVQPSKRVKFEDTHTRQTVWVRKELVDMIEKLSAGERGEKTRIINEALEQYFARGN